MLSANSEGAWAIAQFAALLNAGAAAQKEPATPPLYNMADPARTPILTVAPTPASIHIRLGYRSPAISATLAAEEEAPIDN
jgi:hypothetical protein